MHDNDNVNDNELCILTKLNEIHHKGNINNTYKRQNYNVRTKVVILYFSIHASWPSAYNHL